MAAGIAIFFGPFAPTALASTRGGVLTLHDFVMASAGISTRQALAGSWA